MRIIIVDDNPKSKCGWIMDLLKKEGITYDICTCINDTLNLLYYKSSLYNGMILDMAIPRLRNDTNIISNGGIEIVERLEKRGIFIPTVLNSTMPLQEETFREYKSIKKILPPIPSYGRKVLYSFLSNL